MAKSILEYKFFKAGSAWFVFLLGVALYVVAFVFCGADQYKIWQELLLQLANMCIIGVTVGYITNITALTGIFSEELTKIIYGKIFLTKRKDITSIWENVTKQMFKEKFSSINAELLEIIKGYLPVEDVVFCRDFSINCKMVWVDQDMELVKTTEKISLELVSESKSSIDFGMGVWLNMGDLDDSKCFSDLTGFMIDGKSELKKAKSKIEITKNAKGSILHHDIKVTLTGSNQYKIEYERTKQYSLKYDYDISFKAKYITHGLQVFMTYPKELDVCFVSRGTINEFKDVNISEQNCCKSYKGIILPKQGYIFAFKRKS